MSSLKGGDGVVGRIFAESRPSTRQKVAPPAGAPNIVFIVLDDVGFSDIGCYGAEIATPHIDALAAGGVRYSNFHVTAMCSPTRASLLTGRNAHAVGVGAITDWPNGFPGYEGQISKSAATVAEILSDQAYGTYAIGKWHLSNLASYPSAGPHDQWPLGKGFSRWYGFLGGYVDHWNPDLHEDNHTIRTKQSAQYHLSEDLVDRAIGMIRDHVTASADRPYLTYLAFGAAHWPLHVPSEYIANQKGKYDVGWDVIRERRLAKQKTLGIVPEHTKLAPRNPGVKDWRELTDDERTISTRLQETYAAFMEHTDAQIGRLIDFLSSIGHMENTLIVFLSDNGASGEGGQTGAINIRKHMLLEEETPAYGVANLASIGAEFSFPHYPFGWAQVSNTPLKWYKKNTHGGGIRAPLILHWPNGIRETGIRKQLHHVSDLLPTLLDVSRLDTPTVRHGVSQLPLHGISMAYSFENPNAQTRKDVQYFECTGDRAIWQNGWKAVAKHNKGEGYESDRWELYHLESDFSETCDRAESEPERLKKLIDLWWEEAEKYGVLPLDDRDVERAAEWVRENTPTKYVYLTGMARVDRMLVPAITNRDYQINADIELTSPVTYGVILSYGNRFGGFVWYCDGASIVFEYKFTESTSYMLRGPLQKGRNVYSLAFKKISGASSGQFTLLCNDRLISSLNVAETWPAYAVTAGLTCGFSNTPVTEVKSGRADFTGNLHVVRFNLSEEVTPDYEGAFKASTQGE